MVRSRRHFSVFEHQAMRLGQEADGVRFELEDLVAFQRYFGQNGVPYFSLIHNGIRFNEHVGVIQVGNTVVEVLPKADRPSDGHGAKDEWRSILIEMLFAVGVFDFHAPSSSSLKLKTDSILDLYFELFLSEVESLLHQGLIKKYRQVGGNVNALKGSLQFQEHIQKNLTHHERFYVRHNNYDVDHQIHRILFKTIRLLQKINTNASLHSRIGVLGVHFPEMPDIRITASTFDRLVLNRKTLPYKNAIDISRLLLLRYHPDIVKGGTPVLALMFDMNKLWERFVHVSLRKHRRPGTTVRAQNSKDFWRRGIGFRSRLRPDILITDDQGTSAVLDTKWKNLNGMSPSPDDLRQMFVYLEYFGAKKAALVYPGGRMVNNGGVYLHPLTGTETDLECSCISLSVTSNVRAWQKEIHDHLAAWWDGNEQLA